MSVFETKKKKKFNLGDLAKKRNIPWFNVNITASLTNNDTIDTQLTQDDNDYFQYPEYIKSISNNNNSLFLNFQSFEIIPKSLSKTEPAHFTLNLGRAYLISFDPISSDGLIKLNPQLEQLPIDLNPNEINFGVKFRSDGIKFEEKKEACKLL